MLVVDVVVIINAVLLLINLVLVVDDVVYIVVVAVIAVVIDKVIAASETVQTQYRLFQSIPLAEHRCLCTEKDGDDGGDE